MSAPILATKLYVPPPRPKAVPPPRLIERLDEGLHRKLILVCAPAGFGKTTLLGEWVAALPRPAAWLSLDEGDNDPARFLSYLVAALRTIAPSMGEGLLDALGSPQSPPTESILTALLNEMAALAEDSVFVLDDYHVIHATAVDDALTFLLEHLPPRVKLVIATREDPPLPIARMRARGQLSELRAADLRFILTEAAGFLEGAMGLKLSAEEMAALEERTEGWIAGLQLAALSMRGREDVSGFIAAIKGSSRYVLDYLAEEVLRRQPEDIRAFLLQTSILDRLSGPLCDAITDRAGGQEMLERLERTNLFTIPLDEERRWYRYHHLFSEFLRDRLHRIQPDQELRLHRKASSWYEHNGLVREAVDHALTAADLETATRLVEENFRAMLAHGEATLLLNWMEALPEELLRSRPRLCIPRAWAWLLTGKLEAAELCVQDLERMLDADISRPPDEIGVSTSDEESAAVSGEAA